MATQIYLGNPPENIINWIKADYDKKLTKVVYTDGTTWEGLIEDSWDIPNCENCKNVIVGNTVRCFSAFQECDSLESITIQNGLTSINENEFSNCTSLKEVILPNSVTSIGKYAFESCPSLTSITIPNSVKSIGEGAFSWCESLDSITIPDSVTYIGESAFYECKSLDSITIPDSVTYIGYYAFYNTWELSFVKLPSGITKINDYVFAQSGLTDVIIPNTITSIYGYAFYMNYMNSITIPESVIYIDETAFEECGDLTDVTFEGKTKAEVETMAGDTWFGFGTKNGEMFTVTIHCTDGDIIVNQEEE